MANAVLMASGMGTRMRPLTLTTPKPLIQVNGVPMIETVINGLEKYNIEKIFIDSFDNYKKNLIVVAESFHYFLLGN